MKSQRTLDLAISIPALVALSPILVPVGFLIWLSDRHSPFYMASRVGRGGSTYRMMKFRSMRINADSSGVMSTSEDDDRITTIGRIIRRFKIDELPQLVNVARGEMSLVGPRPQVPTDVAKYTDFEERLLTVVPGITDLASIVFSDEGEILAGSDDPDRRYDELIRPWKSRLALVFVEHGSIRLYFQILAHTARGLIDRDAALEGVSALVRSYGYPRLAAVATRSDPLTSAPPPVDRIE